MNDELDYIRYLIQKINQCHDNDDFLEEKIYQDCLDKFRFMLKNKKEKQK